MLSKRTVFIIQECTDVSNYYSIVKVPILTYFSKAGNFFTNFKAASHDLLICVIVMVFCRFL